MREEVLVFSAMEETVLVRASAVGAALSVSCAVKLETALPSLNPSSRVVLAS